jgi:hypothetical protein
MGFNSSRQEIISTPEARGMRIEPSSRGVRINIARSGLARIGVRTEATQSLERSSRMFGDAEYRLQKGQAALSSEAARSLHLLQADPQVLEAFQANAHLRISSDFAGPDDAAQLSPECQIAAGAEALLVIVNQTLTVFEKSGRQRLRCELQEMFRPLIYTIEEAVIFSPRVLYDPFRSRWAVAACAESSDGLRSWFLFAYSQTTNPTADWWIWALDARLDGGIQTGHTPNSLGFATDNQSFYLTANMAGARGQFLYAKLRVLNRKEVELGGVLNGWDFWDLRDAGGSPALSVQPALNLRAAGVQYLLNADAGGQGLSLWSFMQPPRQNPTLSRRFVPTVPYQLAPNARQPLTRVPVETGNAQLTNVVFRHGMLWTAHTIAANWGEAENVAAIQWFQLNPRAGCIIHQGIYGAPHFHYYAPAVMADGEGNLIVGFNRCGETEFPSIRFTGREPSDEANSLQASLLLQRGASTELPGWAPSSSASIAPEDASFWIAGQYAATGRDQATWLGEVRFAGPARMARMEDALGRFFDQDAAAA